MGGFASRPTWDDEKAIIAHLETLEGEFASDEERSKFTRSIQAAVDSETDAARKAEKIAQISGVVSAAAKGGVKAALSAVPFLGPVLGLLGA